MKIRINNRLLAVGVALALAGCVTSSDGINSRARAIGDPPMLNEMLDRSVIASLQDGGSESLTKAKEAMLFIAQKNLPRASTSINAALQLDSRDSYLHFLNGFIYHLQARQGDSQKNELAIEGYRMALRLDPGNWIAQEFLGLAYLDLKQYSLAKDQFSQALLLAPDTTVSTYGLMVTSYLTGDSELACAMADSYHAKTSGLESSFIRSSVTVYASCGRFDAAEKMRSELLKLDLDPVVAERSGQRLLQWKEYYRSRNLLDANGNATADARFQLAAAFTITNRQEPQPAEKPLPNVNPPRLPPPLASAPQPIQTQPAALDPSQPVATLASTQDRTNGMVLVDVVIIATQETISTAKGINLLNALTLQLGSATAPGYSWTADSSLSRTVITKAVTVPALAYSLNIANAASSTNQVLARPTLAAIEDNPSEFFAGVNINAGVLSTSTLGSASVVPVDKRFGVKLAITPNFLADGMVKLKVGAQRTFIIPNSSNAQFAYRFDISETTTDANVVMKLGDTLVLSGLSEKETSTSRDGVPGLQDVPGVQYLFSQKKSTDFQRSVLILITPRAPAYAAKVEPSVDASSEGEAALRRRLGFSPAVASNVESIVDHLSGAELFRQFRQGDVAIERWDRSRTTADRLKQALGFLYY